jgi:hypothetical protein
VKARIPTAAISRTLQAVATFGVVAPTITSETTEPRVIVDLSRPAEGNEVFASILGELTLEQDVSSTVNFPVASEWDNKSDRRFVDLVDREAKSVATTLELDELEVLSDLRRRFEAPRSGEEVLREYEQQQLVRDLLQSLTRYVEFIGTTAKPGSARSRAKAKA